MKDNGSVADHLRKMTELRTCLPKGGVELHSLPRLRLGVLSLEGFGLTPKDAGTYEANLGCQTLDLPCKDAEQLGR